MKACTRRLSSARATPPDCRPQPCQNRCPSTSLCSAEPVRSALSGIENRFHHSNTTGILDGLSEQLNFANSHLFGFNTDDYLVVPGRTENGFRNVRFVATHIVCLYLLNHQIGFVHLSSCRRSIARRHNPAKNDRQNTISFHSHKRPTPIIHLHLEKTSHVRMAHR